MKTIFASLLLLVAFASSATTQDAPSPRAEERSRRSRARQLELPRRETSRPATQESSRVESALQAVEAEFEILQSASRPDVTGGATTGNSAIASANYSYGEYRLLAGTRDALAALRDGQRLKLEAGGQFSDEYAASLTSIAEMLRAINRDSLDEETSTAMLLAVKEDLEAKAEHLRRDPPARYNSVEPTGGRPRYSVALPPPMDAVNPVGWGVTTVVVRTRLGEMEVGGCEVWFVGRGWANVANRWQRFDAFSNTQMPPRRQLAPGSYIMWAKRGDRDGVRIPVRIGGMGGVEQIIELFAPEP